MEDKYPLNLSQRPTFSREGMRAPSREGQTTTPEVRKKIVVSKSGLSVSGQNFFNSTQKSLQDSQALNDDELTIASINLAGDEKSFSSNIKADLLQLQEEINKMDIDGRIRGMNPSNILKKNHLHAMAKFLSRYSNLNVKTALDKRYSYASSADITDLLNNMNVKSESEGVRKLFKLLGTLDVMLLKLTEYQIISFLNYDQVFEDLRKQLGGQTMTKMATMDSGISISRFQVDFANMERMVELFRFVRKLSQQSQSQPQPTTTKTSKPSERYEPLKIIDTIEDLYKALNAGEALGINDELKANLIKLIEKSFDAKTKETSLTNRIRALEKELAEKTSQMSTVVDFSAHTREDELHRELQDKIQQLNEEAGIMRNELEGQYKRELNKKESEMKEKIRKLEYNLEKKEDEINTLQEQIKQMKLVPQGTQAPVKDEFNGPEYYIKLVKQIEDNYATRAREAEDLNYKKDQQIVDLKTKLEAAERDRDNYLGLLGESEVRESKASSARTKDDNTFEAALREQFNSMKEGFEKKIKNLMSEIQQIKKEKSLENLELKKDLMREKENRELLLRKLQIYTKT